jgi:hypothetical protein
VQIIRRICSSITEGRNHEHKPSADLYDLIDITRIACTSSTEHLIFDNWDEMKISTLVVAALASCPSATFGQHDVLAAEGLLKLGLHVAIEGVPEPKACSLKNIKVRREWYVAREHPSISPSIGVRKRPDHFGRASFSPRQWLIKHLFKVAPFSLRKTELH